MSLGSRLKQARINKGYGVREAARLAGIGASTVSRAERDMGDLDTRTLNALAKCYDATIDSLILDNAPSFRADAATVRRAVLLADLEAMCDNLDDGTDDERDVADVLHTLIIAITGGKVEWMAERSVDMAIEWLGESWRRHVAAQPDAADERDGGGA